jgi:tetratricopeptide (TPR) repeat protein
MIFISYRIADTAQLVGRLHYDLVRLYGPDAVFRDRNTIQGGQAWPDEIRRNLTDRPVTLVVIGPKWDQVQVESGTRAGWLRLLDPDDWVRQEVRTALDEKAKDAAGRHVLPARVNDRKMPDKAWLANCTLGELADYQGVPLRDDDPGYPTDLAALTAALEALCPALQDLRKTLAGGSTPQPGPRPLPGKPPVCVDRADLLKKLADLFLPADADAPLPRLAVAGVGGIGKSTAVLWFLHDPKVKERYGPNRHLVPLDGADSHASLVGKLAEYLGVSTGKDLEPRLLASLEAGERRLIVLDNAETPLESADESKVDAFFGTLAGIPKLGLVATLRRTTPVTGWETTDEVKRLDPPDDLAAFHQHSGKKFQADPDVGAFVATLDGWPLVIRLAALRSRAYRKIADFRKVWAEQRAVLPAPGDDRTTNFAVCVALSLNSRQMTPDGRRLLAALARLPDGVRYDDLAGVFGDGSAEADAAVRTVGGLVIEDRQAGRLRMLAPLREHLGTILPFEEKDREQVIRYYCQIAGERKDAPSGKWEEVNARLAREIANVQAAVRWGFELPDRALAYGGVCGLGRYGSFLGLDYSELLRQAVEIAREHREPLAEAHCVKDLGNIALVRSGYQEADKHFTAALALFRQEKDVLGEARCRRSLGDIARQQYQHDPAREHYEEAHRLFRQVVDMHGEAPPRYDRDRAVLGVAKCIQGLGDVDLVQSKHAGARTQYETALPLFRQVGDVLGEANCLTRLGEIALFHAEYPDARRHIETVLPLYRRIGAVLGEASSIWLLGNIALKQGDPGEAERRYDEAIPLYKRVRSDLGEANCLQGLGEVALARAGPHLPRARELFENALHRYQSIPSVIGQAECMNWLGDVARAEGDADRARERYEEALTLAPKIRDPFLTGLTYRNLARVAVDPAERARFVAAARELWAPLDLPHRIAELDQEFPPSPPAAGAT